MRDELRVSEEFLARYIRPGPRYTSYPTAPVWNDSFGPADLEKVHQEADAAKSPVSLYMHIPFCESLCLFCACNVIIQKNKAVAPPYLEILKREITSVSRSVSKDRPVVQFHWGGGTPTYLTPRKSKISSASHATTSDSPPTPKSASKSTPALPAATTSKPSAN